MTPLELLAPAKNLACGMAAIDHGADAVYIGAPKYGARAAVGNSIGDIRKLCEYAHPYGVKIYVTLNTIVYDSELEEIHRLIDQLAEIGVDAILVQDMGLLQFLQDKPFEIHASTQTDNRTAEKVRWLPSQERSWRASCRRKRLPGFIGKSLIWNWRCLSTELCASAILASAMPRSIASSVVPIVVSVPSSAVCGSRLSMPMGSAFTQGYEPER